MIEKHHYISLVGAICIVAPILFAGIFFGVLTLTYIPGWFSAWLKDLKGRKHIEDMEGNKKKE